MSNFSWLKADKLTKYGNIYYGCPFKILIPKEFGGGAISGVYQGYGRVASKLDVPAEYDIYELYAIINADCYNPVTGKYLRDELIGVQRGTLKRIDAYTTYNRICGSKFFHAETAQPKYPLKLVTDTYTRNYEHCAGVSIADPEQGYRRTRDYYKNNYNI